MRDWKGEEVTSGLLITSHLTPLKQLVTSQLTMHFEATCHPTPLEAASQSADTLNQPVTSPLTTYGAAVVTTSPLTTSRELWSPVS